MSVIRRDRGIVLRQIPHGETSNILTVYMREHGKIGLMVKGARAKKKSGTNLALEVLSRAQFVYYYKPARDLQLAKEWVIEAAHLGTRAQFAALTISSAIIELLLRCTPPDDPHAVLFDAASETLQSLDSNPIGRIALLWKFELTLFNELGFGLQMSQCAQTKIPLHPPFNGLIRYRIADGAFFHPSATSLVADGALTPESFSLLASLGTHSSQFVSRMSTSPRTEQDIREFMSRYLEAHLPVNGALKSLHALNW